MSPLSTLLTGRGGVGALEPKGCEVASNPAPLASENPSGKNKNLVETIQDHQRERVREIMPFGEVQSPKEDITEHVYGKVCNKRKKISVILNFYNKADTVFQTLESLDRQHFELCAREDIEIIIVDDGTEGSRVSDRLPDHVLYLWQKKNAYGICRAKNTGAKLSNGEYLVFLDPDLKVGPGYFDAILRNFRAFGERVIQCGYIWSYHFEGCPDPRTEFGVWEKPERVTNRFYQIAGGNMAVSRRLFCETPGFDEDLIYGGVEDLLFGYHLGKLQGTSVLFSMGLESWHIPHPPGGAHLNPGKTWEVVRRKWPEFYDDYIVKGLR